MSDRKGRKRVPGSLWQGAQTLGPIHCAHTDCAWPVRPAVRPAVHQQTTALPAGRVCSTSRPLGSAWAALSRGVSAASPHCPGPFAVISWGSDLVRLCVSGAAVGRSLKLSHGPETASAGPCPQPSVLPRTLVCLYCQCDVLFRCQPCPGDRCGDATIPRQMASVL